LIKSANGLITPESIDIYPMIARNNEVMQDIQSTICVSIASSKPNEVLEPKRVYDFVINPCGAAFFEIHCSHKQSPL
jgi:hypothetical protein